jgi:hypothetical protein
MLNQNHLLLKTLIMMELDLEEVIDKFNRKEGRYNIKKKIRSRRRRKKTRGGENKQPLEFASSREGGTIERKNGFPFF